MWKERNMLKKNLRDFRGPARDRFLSFGGLFKGAAAVRTQASSISSSPVSHISESVVMQPRPDKRKTKCSHFMRNKETH